MTTVVNIDYVLLAVLLFLTIFACCYCLYHIYILSRSGQIDILLKPTRVLFAHKQEGQSTEQLRTVVAYQNPFTGDYCVRKSGGPHGYLNQLQVPQSPDSGLSDEYEPLHLDPAVQSGNVPGVIFDPPGRKVEMDQPTQYTQLTTKCADNTLNKTWNWNYKEYQI